MNQSFTIAVFLLLVGLVVWLAVSRLRIETRRRHLSEHITNNMPSGMLTVDMQGVITAHNPASQQIFGYDLGTGRRLSDLVEQRPRLDAMLERCLQTGEAFTRQEFNVANPTDGGRHIGVNLSPITGATGRIEGALCLLSDLTQIAKLQEQVRLKDNFAALGEMSAGIAHEFKNSLATISGYSQMLSSEPDPEKMRAYAREIEKETRALAQIVTDFLHFARPVKASLRAAELEDLVAGAVEDLKGVRPGGYEVEVRSSKTADVVCDAALLKQAVFNLLLNAADAIGEDGAIRVEIELDNNAGKVRLHIIDNGCGIDPDDMKRAFIPFFTTKPSGTGLGLPLVQKIVLAHDGDIAIDSHPGRGTRASLSLPAKPGSSE